MRDVISAGFVLIDEGPTLVDNLMGVSLVVVFLLLAALYESWAVPIAVLLVVPLGVLGSVLLTMVRGMSADDIAMSVANPSTDAAQGIAGAANVLTATICTVTNGQPVNVCTDPAVAAAAKKLQG